jgi:putative hemolysin|tara:strand:+ start:7179 stop:7997 length:819 start_codon:yes stop_codon:yes gene_type:complete
MAKEKTIDIRKLIASKNPGLLKWLPGFVIRYLERILHQDDINQFMEDHPNAHDADFCDDVMKYLNIKIVINNLEKLPKEGKLVLAMNHPLGGMDAIALVSGLRDTRTDLKYIVNDLLLNLNRMNGHFLGVDKHGKNSHSKREQINELFASDYLVSIFPAGLVSRKVDGKVRDLVWKKTFITLSKANDRTIVPMHIDGHLSNFFYRLSNFRSKIGIKANIEMLYLSNELFKLRNSTITMTFGDPIPARDLDPKLSDLEQAQWVKEKVYQLESK